MAKSDREAPRYRREADAARVRGARRSDGRIAADPARQAPHGPRTRRPSYGDLEFACRDCGVREVWTAERQQRWYEVARGPIDSTAIRCRACRAALRASHGGTPRISAADRGRDHGVAPGDPD